MLERLARHSLLPLLATLSGVTTGFAPAATVTPVPRTDQNSKIAHEQLLAKAKQGRIDIYFAGDSITRRWGCSDRQYQAFLANWRTNFFGWNAANFGWGGDTVQNILWRLENGELEGVNPRIIVLLAGTNNLGPNSTTGAGADARVEEVGAGIRATWLRQCAAGCPSGSIATSATWTRGARPCPSTDSRRCSRACWTIARFAC